MLVMMMHLRGKVMMMHLRGKMMMMHLVAKCCLRSDDAPAWHMNLSESFLQSRKLKRGAQFDRLFVVQKFS